MALPPVSDANESFVREVDEEFRRDQLLGLWQKYGRIGIGVIVGGLALLAAWLLWQHFTDQSAGKTGRQFEEALKTSNKGELAKIADGKGDGYRAMARFTQADLALASNDTKTAAKLLGEIAGDSKLAQPLRDRALVQQTAVEFDTLKPETVIDRLRGFATASSPWFGTAGEMVAIAYLRQGKRKEAGQLFSQIGQAPDNQVPDSIRQRALQQAGILGVYANDQLNEDKKPK